MVVRHGFDRHHLPREAYRRMIGEMLDQVGKRTVFFRLHDVMIGRDERLALASGAQKDDGNVRRDSA